MNGSTKGAFEMWKAGWDCLGSAGVQAGPGAAWVGRGVPLDLGWRGGGVTPCPSVEVFLVVSRLEKVESQG